MSLRFNSALVHRGWVSTSLLKKCHQIHSDRVRPSLGLDVAITFFFHCWELLNSVIIPRTKKSWFWIQFRNQKFWNLTPNKTEFSFGFIFALQLPNVQGGWIKHTQLQAFYLTSGLASKYCSPSHPSPWPFLFLIHSSSVLQIFLTIVQRNWVVYFHGNSFLEFCHLT